MKTIVIFMLHNHFQLILKVLTLSVNIELFNTISFSQNSLFSSITDFLTSFFDVSLYK